MIALVCALSAPAASQTPTQVRPAEHSPDLHALAQQMPDCKEFRNACEVCGRRADGKFDCSNIGIACGPSGDWRCSAPTKTDAPTK